MKPSAPYVSASASSEGSHRPVRLSISSLSQPISAVTISKPPPIDSTTHRSIAVLLRHGRAAETTTS